MGRRIWGFLFVVVLAAAAASVGHAERAPQVRQPTCPATRSPAPGWEAQFGHAATLSAAETIRARAERAGFAHLVTEPACEGGFDVVLRGICPFGSARGLQSEARKAGFAVVLEYKKPVDFGSDLVVVFNHFRTHAAADAFRSRVENAGFKFVRVYNDGGCNPDWEVLVGGVDNRSQAEDLANEARDAGFPFATVEYA
jgi:cell division septation protein DedD